MTRAKPTQSSSTSRASRTRISKLRHCGDLGAAWAKAGDLKQAAALFEQALRFASEMPSAEGGLDACYPIWSYFLVRAPPSWVLTGLRLFLIILTVLTHVLGLNFIRGRAIRAFNQIGQRHHPTVVFVTGVGAATLSATILHADEASSWASAYKFLGGSGCCTRRTP
jgi:hypothetical protein